MLLSNKRRNHMETQKYHRVRDHCHDSGELGGAAHSILS